MTWTRNVLLGYTGLCFQAWCVCVTAASTMINRPQAQLETRYRCGLQLVPAFCVFFPNNPEGFIFCVCSSMACVCLHVHVPHIVGQLLAARTETLPQTDILGKRELEPPHHPPHTSQTNPPAFIARTWTQAKSSIWLLSSLRVSSVQKLQTFQSLSCPGFSAADGHQASLPLPYTETSSQPDSDFFTACVPGLESPQEVAGDDEEEDSSYEELDSDSACSVDSRPGSPDGVVADKRALWKGDRMTQRDIFQLGGELDLDQIERNWTLYRRF